MEGKGKRWKGKGREKKGQRGEGRKEGICKIRNKGRNE